MKSVSKDQKPKDRDIQTVILFGVLAILTFIFVLSMKWLVLAPTVNPGVQRVPSSNLEEAVGSR